MSRSIGRSGSSRPVAPIPSMVLAMAGTCLLAITTTAKPQTPPPAESATIEVDAVVLDKNDRPVRGLRPEDFQIKEDGRSVARTTFAEVSAAGIAGQADGRTVVMLLDDNGVALNGTTIVQNIARLFVSQARPADTIAVVRLTHRDDEAAGGMPAALERIDEYRTGSLSFFGRDMREDMLLTVTRVAHQLEPVEHRRKALVCIGARDTCDPYFAVPQSSLLWKSWRDTITATARANASVYVVSPTGVTGRIDLGGGLADTTGGGAFMRSNDFARDARMIWDEASHYYLLGYTSTGRRRDLHAIDISVKRSGLHVRARQSRGE